MIPQEQVVAVAAAIMAVVVRHGKVQAAEAVGLQPRALQELHIHKVQELATVK